MKSFHSNSVIALAIVFLISTQVTYAGTRYKDLVFPSVTVTSSIQFGSNLNVDGSNAPLLLDLYQPTNDTLKLRPLVICIHGGSLIAGSRGDMGAFCTDFAKRGYVSATIEYRLGIESPKNVRTIEEALLLGVQDTKAAVRFFRSKAAQYGIDTSQIYIEGSSAGSMVAVHYAYWDQNELPTDINQAKWGDIEGTSGNPGFSSAIKGIINYCGAIMNPAWINADEVPVANFHGLLDTIVPPDSGVSTDFTVKMYGGVAISRAATQLGIYNQGAFFPLMGHGGNEDSLRVFSSNFLYSLMVLSSASPQDFTLMELSAKTLKLFRYDSYMFLTSALDRSGNRIILPRSMIQYSCTPRIGSIASSGIFSPSDHPDSGYVYVKFNNRTDSCFVKTYDFKYFLIRPKVAVTDLATTLKLSIDTYDAALVKHDLAITKFKLISTSPSVGTIDSTGAFTGKKNGTTSIVASCNGYSDTSVVRVESASGLVSLDPLESLSGWRVEGTNLDSLSVTLATDQKSAGTASFRIDYKLTYDPLIPSYMVYLYKDMLVYGVPDSIYLDVKSDGRRHRLYYSFSDANSGTFRALAKKYLNNSVAFDVVNTPMTGLTLMAGIYDMSYPLTLKRIEIQLAGDIVQGQSTSGTIYVDNLRLKYPGTVSDVEKTPLSPTLFKLEQNYPNPFNPSTTIQYEVPSHTHVVLTIYNILGQSVAELVNAEKDAGHYETRFDASGFASGVYLYRLQAGSFVQTRKLVVLK
ncbi:MAG: T9SS type A sorting domain-containing protein [Ignavibacteriales bacterium]|nr:T9SS type A sorting domain-containing protein [Ignavibacteriales bacterium]